MEDKYWIYVLNVLNVYRPVLDSILGNILDAKFHFSKMSYRAIAALLVLVVYFSLAGN